MQRGVEKLAVEGLLPDDALIMTSDVDELPHPRLVRWHSGLSDSELPPSKSGIYKVSILSLMIHYHSL